jgi:hypothetical protein
MFGFGKYSAQILTPPPISKKQITMPAKPKIRKEDLLPDFKHTPPPPKVMGEWQVNNKTKPLFPEAVQRAKDIVENSNIKEMVNGPQHYGGVDNPYEVIKVCEAWGLDKDAYLFNVVKYVARAGKKDPQKELEDLKKAIFYLQRKVENLQK